MIHHQVVIVGGGEAGLAVAARLLANCPGVDVAIIEPCRQHDFKRMWMLVGGGALKPEESRRQAKGVTRANRIPAGRKKVSFFRACRFTKPGQRQPSCVAMVRVVSDLRPGPAPN